MRKYLISLLFSFLLSFGFFIPHANATGVYDLPILSAGANTYIIDNSSSISAANEGKLNKDLAQLAKNTGNEVRMVVVRRLDYGQKIDNLADDIFSEWYPNPEDKAGQTLIVLDTLTNKTAIRVGERTKTLLDDATATSIISETMAAPLKDGGKYNQALLDATRRLVPILSGEKDPGPPETAEINIDSTFTSAEETDDKSATIWVVVLLVLATVIPMATYFWYAR